MAEFYWNSCGLTEKTYWQSEKQSLPTAFKGTENTTIPLENHKVISLFSLQTLQRNEKIISPCQTDIHKISILATKYT